MRRKKDLKGKVERELIVQQAIAEARLEEREAIVNWLAYVSQVWSEQYGGPASMSRSAAFSDASQNVARGTHHSWTAKQSE